MAIRQAVRALLIVLGSSGTLHAAPAYDGMVLTPERYIPSLNVTNKYQIDCGWIAGRKPFVLFGIGQSLIANTNGEHEWGQVTFQNVYEQWNGKCYKANAPLYGASEARKSFMLPLADMIARALDRDVLINMAAVGGKDIDFFSEGGPGYDLIMDQIKATKAANLPPDAILFEHGQGNLNTPDAEYRQKVNGLFEAITAAGITAPRFIAVDTILQWRTNPAMEQNQRELAKEPNNILGPNIDLIRFRRDGAHLDEAGLKMQAVMWFQALAQHFCW